MPPSTSRSASRRTGPWPRSSTGKTNLPCSPICSSAFAIRLAKTRRSSERFARENKDKGIAMAKFRHPRGLAVLFFAEMWERFSFYLILGILYQYLTDYQKGGLGMKGDDAAVIVGSYQALVYFTPFIGGLLADRLFGCRRMIVVGGLLMMCGHLVLAWPEKLGLFMGLGLLCLGNGGFKPNISTLVGNLYEPDSPLRDAGYNIFYMGINLGAFICNFIAAFVRNYVADHPIYLSSTWKVSGWHAAFATAAVGMLVGVIVFSLNYRLFAKADQNSAAYEG